MSRLTKLEAENVKRLVAISIKPKKGVNVVRGKNGAGKTSALDSVVYLFGGAKTHPPKVIRDGQTHAQVIGETEELVATRRWWKTDDGERTELEVRAKDGTPIPTPQKVLDRMFSSALASDPTSFVRLKPPERLELLRKLVGVDTSLVEKERERIFTERTLTNRDLAQAHARLKVMPNAKPPPTVDTAALLKEQAALVFAQQNLAARKSEADATMRRIRDCEEAVKVAKQALVQAETRLAGAMEQAGAADNALDDAQEKAEGSSERLSAIRAALEAAQAAAAVSARWSERARLVADVATLEAKAGGQTAEIAKLDARKEEIVAAAKFPVDGLGFGDGDVTFNGLPLEQSSGAQRIRLGVALAIASNPKLRVMIVPEGSNLDEDSLALLEELCEKHDMQAFVEQVSEAGPAGIIIRDGVVLEDGR